MQTVFVTTSSHPTQLMAAGDGPTLIFNNDEVNPLYLSNEIGLNVTNADNLSILEPLGSVVMLGHKDVYAAPATPGQTIEVFMIPDASYYSPSPAQIAAQINALGLATATNQGTQIGHEINIDTATTSSQGKIGLLDSGYPNAYFTGPDGAADLSGWTGSGGIAVTAGNLGSVAMAPGAGHPNGAQITPSGTQSFCGVNSGVSVPIVPGQSPYCHFTGYGSGLVGTYLGNINFQFYTNTGAFISQVQFQQPVAANAQWQRYYAVCPAANVPATAAWYTAQPSINISAGNIPNTVLIYITAVITHTLGVPGTRHGDAANHIANAGVPLNRLHNTLFSVASVTTAGVALNEPASPVAFKQIGYTFSFGCYSAVGAVFTPLQVIVTWSDAASGITVDQQIYWMVAGNNNANVHSVRITGPTEGNQVQIQFNAFNENVTITNLAFFQSSTIYSRHFPLTISSSLLSGGGNIAASDTLANVLGTRTAAALAANGTDVSYLPLYTGRVWIHGHTGAAVASNMRLYISNPVDQGVAGNVILHAAECNAAGDIDEYVELPREQCTISMVNQNAGAQTLTYAILIAPEG